MLKKKLDRSGDAGSLMQKSIARKMTTTKSKM